MIANERQYRITKAWLAKFERQAAQQESEADVDPEMEQLYRDAYESQAEELRVELSEYEALRAGHVSVVELDSLMALPDALIQARIVAGLTQKQIATRLGLKEQQVQRYEASRYSSATLARLQAVVDALGVQIREQVILPVVG